MHNLFLPQLFYDEMGRKEKRTPKAWTLKHVGCDHKMVMEIINTKTGESCLVYMCHDCKSVVRGDKLYNTK